MAAKIACSSSSFVVRTSSNEMKITTLQKGVHSCPQNGRQEYSAYIYNECVFCWDYVATSVVPNAEGKWAESLFRWFQSVIVCGKRVTGMSLCFIRASKSEV